MHPLALRERVTAPLRDALPAVLALALGERLAAAEREADAVAERLVETLREREREPSELRVALGDADTDGVTLGDDSRWQHAPVTNALVLTGWMSSMPAAGG